MYKFPPDTNPHLILFSDLDGTLLDHHSYSWEPARQALEKLSETGVALIPSSSKALAELRVLAHELHNNYPCIVENGGGIAWPQVGSPGSYAVEPLGQERSRLLQVLEPLRGRYRFRSCQEMDVGEFAALTGLTEVEASRAMARQFSEPMLWQDDPGRIADFAAELQKNELSLLRGGRFLHLMGTADKGRAMDRVVQRWATGLDYQIVALGDSHNDVAMLERADIAVVVRSPSHPPPEFSGRGVRWVTDLEGPAGWNNAVLKILKRSKR